MARRTRLELLLFLVAAVGAPVACGSRTGLLAGETLTAPDSGEPTDAAFDTGDEPLPELDGAPTVDVVRNDCPDADSTLVYLVTEDDELLAFFPPDASFRRIGTLACPDPVGGHPFSMAVDRKGIAYVLYDSGYLYRVSTATASCQSTPFQPAQAGFLTFGMGFSTDQGGPAETLYVAGDESSSTGGAGGLASIDVGSFVLSPIADFSPAIDRAELTGNGAGQLFAFYSSSDATDSFVGQIDKPTAHVLSADRISGVPLGQGWAFANWGGDFWLFTGTPAGSRVTRYRPSDKSITTVARYPALVVGAGVSTCAPER